MYSNISVYKFARLANLKPLRDRLIAQCREWGLKGTILLSTEGVNLFVAGLRENVDALVNELRAIPGLEDLAPKYSESTAQPFTRMLVRIKKEIIAFGVDGIDPAQHTSPKLPACTLKQWLDEGRPLVLLDTRNDYEVKLGTFRGAKHLGIDHFRNFPEAVRKLPPDMKTQPIVMFCTGGIRCEKAGPFMEREGFQQIFQLEGGILKYFEECGGDHYEGECFVFDQRVGVDPALRETASTQCFACQTPLTTADQDDPRYVPGKSCPYCFQTEEQQMALTLATRQQAIHKAAHPLPGSSPYENRRPVYVSAIFDGSTLLKFICQIFPHQSQENWERLCAEGRFLNKKGKPVSASQIVRAGERYECVFPASAEPDVNAGIRILHEDQAIIALNKPAPLPMHPSGRFNRNTLHHFLKIAYAPEIPHPAHRLDANTTGLVICARTRHFARLLQPQFEHRTVEKIYLARVQGHPAEDTFICEAPISAEPQEFGARRIDEEKGLDARTEFHVKNRYDDGTALLEVKPLTGRTNQIRVHLWQAGLPICGDPTYLSHHRLGPAMALSPADPPLCLHSLQITFLHPHTRQRTTFTTPPPPWAFGTEFTKFTK